MYLVAIAWMYVVLMMAVAEAISSQGTLLGAFFTLVLYGLLPLGILLYIMGTPMRRRASRQEAALESVLEGAAATPLPAGTEDGAGAASPPPDGSRMSPGNAVPTKGKEV